MFETMHYVMVTVSDMKKSIDFYQNKLGIPLKIESPEWTEFLTQGTTLALHGGGVKKTKTPEDAKCAGVCTFGFSVSNLNQVYEDLKSKGVMFVMPPTQREGEGIKLAVAIDPDGLAISFAEMVK